MGEKGNEPACAICVTINTDIYFITNSRTLYDIICDHYNITDNSASISTNKRQDLSEIMAYL